MVSNLFLFCSTMFRPGMRGRGRGQAQGFALFLLFTQMMRMGMNNIPPVTLFGIIGQVFCSN